MNAVARTVAGAALAAMSAQALAQQYLMITDTDDDRVMLFDAHDGSLVDENFILLDDFVSAATPFNAIQVGNQIWVNDGTRDAIYRTTLDGGFIDTIGGFGANAGFNDTRGMTVVGNQVYIVNDGASNGAPGDDTVVILNSTTAAVEGGFALRGEAEDILRVGNELYINNRDGNPLGGSVDDTIDVYDLSGNYLRTVVQSTGFGDLNSPQQMNLSSNGLLVASESFPNAIFEYDLSGNELDMLDSAALGTFNSIHGVFELGNGDILFTVNNEGVFSYNRLTGEVTEQLGGVDPLYIELLVIPAPGSVALLCGAGLLATRRRR